MIDLLEKLISEAFEDTFQPASEEEVQRRYREWLKEIGSKGRKFIEEVGKINWSDYPSFDIDDWTGSDSFADARGEVTARIAEKAGLNVDDMYEDEQLMDVLHKSLYQYIAKQAQEMVDDY